MKKRRTTKQKKIRHIPQRTCIACRKIQDKREMVRLVYSGETGIQPDTSGKMSGRGAYLCKDISCWEEGLKGNRLDHALKTGIDNREKTRLLDWIKEYVTME